MRSDNWTGGRILAVSAVVLLGFAIHPAFAQKGAAPPPAASSPSNAPTANAPTGTRGTPGNIPNSFPGSVPNNPTTPSMARPIFLAGKVMFDDGTAPSIDIRIERVCGGMVHLESHADSKGRFSFQVGQNTGIDTDASDASSGGNFGGQSGQFSSRSGNLGGNSNPMDPLWNCDLRAAYPGYRSDEISLASHRELDDSDMGTIVLHRLSNVKGTTISLTTSLAPKHAQKEYEKGLQLAQKGKFDEAEKHFLAATDTYPKYAVAWYALGQVQQRENKPEDARKSYQAAAAADSKFVSPYDQLALLAAQSGKWQDAADYSKQVIQLNPVEFPSDFWYNAVASYNLKKPADAEKSTRELLKLDTGHKYPQAESMLAQILLEKGDNAEAATHLRAYLTLVPNAKNADVLKQALLKIEQANAEAKK